MSRDLIERLRADARQISKADRYIAQAKSRRQPDNPTGDDVYSWVEPEQTVAWEAADEITRLRAELSSLRGEGACAVCGIANKSHFTHGAPFGPDYHEYQPPTPDSDVIGRLVGAVRAFMPTGISYSNPNIPDDVMIPLDVTMGELRAINAALASIPSTEGSAS